MTNAELRSIIAAIREMQELAQTTLDSPTTSRDHQQALLRSKLVKVSNLIGYDAVRFDPRRDGVNRVEGVAPRPAHVQAFLDWAGRPTT